MNPPNGPHYNISFEPSQASRRVIRDAKRWREPWKTAYEYFRPVGARKSA